jgi:DNA-binding IclR family transcriptional regulator
MKVSISRSVGRAFAVLEAFGETRRPATATDLSRKLGSPHSSTVAVLYNLVELGFLSHDPGAGLFYPTMKLLDLGSWMAPAQRGGGNFGWLVDRVARDTGHTAVLSSRVSLFVQPVATRRGNYPALGPSKTVGAALANSIPGVAILGQMDDDEVSTILRDTCVWLKEAGAKAIDVGRVRDTINAVRQRGFLAGVHPQCDSTEIIACGVAAGVPMALAVHVPAILSRSAKIEARQALEARVRDYAGVRVGQLAPAWSVPGMQRPRMNLEASVRAS